MNTDPLVEAAGLVADGVVLDWGSVSSRLSTDEERAVVDELAVVARVAAGHRQFHQGQPVDAGGQVALDRKTWGHLELLEVLGRGSYGTVYRAWDGRLDRQVALKLFHGPRDPDAVMREGRMLAKIRHDNVVAVYGTDVIDGIAGIWMEFIKGRNLDQIVKEQGPMSAQEATLVGLDMSRALAAVHGAGLLHCDVKAQNVVREPGGRLVLMDLGASRTAPGANDTTVIAHLVGTPRYMAPELFDRAPASPQSDIYSLGVLLFFLVTGRYPTTGRTLTEIRQAHAEKRLVHLRDVRPELPTGYLREVSRALDRNPLARHHSAGDLEAGLLSLSPAPPGVTRAPVSKRRRISRAVPIAAALALVLAVGSFVWNFLPSPASARPQSIAVLPIRNLTGDPSKNYLADGLTEVLISNLVRVKALRVPSFAAVASFRNESSASRQTAEKLGVDLLLAGSIVEAGARTRITVQLVDPEADTVLWGEEITTDSSRVLAAQADIARTVTARLSLELSPEERKSLSQATLNPRAQDAYLRGLVGSQTPLDLNAAKAVAAAFRTVVELEPTFAPAWAELALAELRLVDRVAAPGKTQRADSVKMLAQRAIEIDPTLATGYLALGSTQFYHQWDFEGAEATLRTALALSPSSGEIRQRLAMLLAALGRTSEAIVLGREGRDLEPLLPLRASSLGLLYYYARDFGPAEIEMRRALEISPEYAPALFGLGRIFSAAGRHDEAVQAIERALKIGRPPAYVVELVRAKTAAGDTEDVAPLLAELAERLKRGEAYGLDNHAYIAAAAGRLDEAFAILNRAIDERSTNVLWIEVDPRVDPLRNDPRFGQLLSRIGVRR